MRGRKDSPGHRGDARTIRYLDREGWVRNGTHEALRPFSESEGDVLTMSIRRSLETAGRVAACAALGASVLFFSTAARAQEPGYAVHQEAIKGIVRSFDGQWIMYVRAQNGSLDRVALHKGTIITPTGLTLEPGMHVTVYGHPGADAFVADDIETPYRYIPYPGMYRYPYPAWGFGFGWGWRHGWCCG